MYVYICIYICTYIYMYLYKCIYIKINMYIHIHVNIYIIVYLPVYIFTYIYKCIYTLTNLRLGLLFEIPPSPVSREVVTCLATKCLFHLTFTLSLISDLPSPDMLSRRMYEHRVMEQLACWDSTLYSVSVGISREFSRRVIASHV